jgi:hypothetical protein
MLKGLGTVREQIFSPARRISEARSCGREGIIVYEHTYRNTIAGSPPGKRIFVFFEKIRFASQKLNFSIFLANKLVKMTLNSLEVTKCCKN